MHTLATVLVAVGTSLSAFWILVLNSWMHTPTGFEMRDGVAHATDWLAILLNPSMPYRFVHVMLSSFLTVAFLLAGLSAWRWLRGDQKSCGACRAAYRTDHGRGPDAAADRRRRSARPEHAASTSRRR
jgi:cytochrome bd ubiquinol oxidase subunit I